MVTDVLEEQFYARTPGSRALFEDAGRYLPGGVTSFFQVHFGVISIMNKRDALNENKETARQFHLGLRANGIMVSPHPLFLSAAHTEEHVHHILDISETVLSEMKQGE